MKFHHILAAGLAATALLGAPAQAMSKRTEVSIAVDFNDLDLRDPSQPPNCANVSMPQRKPRARIPTRCRSTLSPTIVAARRRWLLRPSR